MNSITTLSMPELKAQLQSAKAEIQLKADMALNLICTPDTLKDVKAARAALNKEYKELEEERKRVKAELTKPYIEFEELYKEYIGEPYKAADEQLKAKIASVEDMQRTEKQKRLQAYFDKACADKNLSGKLTDAIGKINLSVKDKEYEELIDAWVSIRTAELIAIDLQDNADEIRYEYFHNGFDCLKAIQTVKERHEAIKKPQADDLPFPAENEIYEKPKYEHTIVFSVTHEEYSELLRTIAKFDYEEIIK